MNGRDAPLRLIQVGGGEMGKIWLQTIAARPEVELAGLVDLNLDAARAALAVAGMPGVPVATSVSELAAQVGADAVLNVTVPGAHLPVNREALAAGLPVLCEKPASPTVADALRQAAWAAVSGKLLMISQSRRYFAGMRELKARIAELGDIGTVSTVFAKAPHFGGFREQMEHVLLVDMAIHPFDAVRYLLGREPVAVYCEEYNPGWSWYAGAANAAAVFEFEGGTRYVYNGSWCSPGAETSWNGTWRVSAEGGTVLWDGEGAPTVHPADGPDLVTNPAPIPTETAGSLAEFVDALRGGPEPDSTIASNVRSLVMVEAAVQSSVAGSRVLIADVLSQARQDAFATESDERVRQALQGMSL